MIREAIVITLDADGAPHITPLGYRMIGDEVLLAPFIASQTLANLRRSPHAVLNFTDDVRILAGCLTGRRDWPTRPALRGPVPRLAEALAHWELAVLAVVEDAERPQFRCAIVARAVHGEFTGFSRAQSAVLEAAILVSRLDRLAPAKVARELGYLRSAIDKTAGPREQVAWAWLLAAVQAHPRHRAHAGGAR
ncbi:MAG: DUF447 family protein [Gammaproteobacteria bacterium]|nr:DUF447 family protein [Gammaproteobacteria bacterium]